MARTRKNVSHLVGPKARPDIDLNFDAWVKASERGHHPVSEIGWYGNGTDEKRRFLKRAARRAARRESLPED